MNRNRALALIVVLTALVLRSPVHAQANKVWTDQDIQELAKPATVPLPVGTKITQQNWEQYQGYMIESMRVLFRGDHHFKMPPGVEIVVGPHTPLPLPKLFQAATEKYSGSAKLVPAPEFAPGALKMEGYRGGLAFPNPQEPNRGTKIEYTTWFTYSPAVDYLDDKFIVADRFGDVTVEAAIAVEGKTSFVADPGYAESNPKVPGYYYFEYIELTAPEELRYSTSLELWSIDQSQFPALYAFVPALRRVLRLSAAAVCSPIAGTDVTYDDGCTNQSNCQQIPLFDAKYLGEKKILQLVNMNPAAAAPGANGIQAFDSKYFYNSPAEFAAAGQWPFPKPSAGSWELRDVYVVALRRLPSLRRGYCYGTRMFYIDKEDWRTKAEDFFDPQERYYKGSLIGYMPERIPQTNDVFDEEVYGNFWSFEDWHGASGIFPQHQLNQNAGKYNDTTRYGSVAGLQQVMQ